MIKDGVLQDLLDLDGERFVIDEVLGLWIKIDVKKVDCSISRPHGIKYSLTLHDRFNKRIMGFDNSHAIDVDWISSIITFDHWHQSHSDEVKKYNYENAAQLLNDFCCQVNSVVKKLREELQYEYEK